MIIPLHSLVLSRSLTNEKFTCPSRRPVGADEGAERSVGTYKGVDTFLFRSSEGDTKRSPLKP